MSCISFEISCVTTADCSASSLTSSATTATSFPCSPALAASMLAFNTKTFVCSDIAVIVVVILAIVLDFSKPFFNYFIYYKKKIPTI